MLQESKAGSALAVGHRRSVSSLTSASHAQHMQHSFFSAPDETTMHRLVLAEVALSGIYQVFRWLTESGEAGAAVVPTNEVCRLFVRAKALPHLGLVLRELFYHICVEYGILVAHSSASSPIAQPPATEKSSGTKTLPASKSRRSTVPAAAAPLKPSAARVSQAQFTFDWCMIRAHMVLDVLLYFTRVSKFHEHLPTLHRQCCVCFGADSLQLRSNRTKLTTT